MTAIQRMARRVREYVRSELARPVGRCASCARPVWNYEPYSIHDNKPYHRECWRKLERR